MCDHDHAVSCFATQIQYSANLLQIKKKEFVMVLVVLCKSYLHLICNLSKLAWKGLSREKKEQQNAFVLFRDDGSFLNNWIIPQQLDHLELLVKIFQLLDSFCSE